MPSSSLIAQLHSSDCSELLFVDAAAQQPETIQAMLRPGVELIHLGVGRPALTQIATALRDRPTVGTVHILAHGAPGVLQFAAGSIGRDDLPHHAGALAEIAELIDGGEIMLWSCRTGAGAEADGAFAAPACCSIWARKPEENASAATPARIQLLT